MKRRHRVKEWPHFFEKPAEEGVYRSDKILGQLYDMVERVAFVPCYDLGFDPVIMGLFTLDAEELQQARQTKREYDVALRRIMVQHEITTEFEVWSTFVMHHGSSNDYKFHEEIGEISFSLKERFRKLVLSDCKDRKYDLPRKVAAMYVVTAQDIEETKSRLQQKREKKAPMTKGMVPTSAQVHREDIDKLPLMSFPWVFPDILVDLAHNRVAMPPRYGGAELADAKDDEMEEVSIDSLIEGEVPAFFSID
jgi:RNA-dependent RNA polymerase